MSEVASRELRNNTRAVLDMVAGGESVTITVDGRPVARLSPVGRPTWISTNQVISRIAPRQADPGLAQDLPSLTGGETTDDLPL